MLTLAHIGTAVDWHNVDSVKQFLRKQKAFIAQQKLANPRLPWKDPFESDLHLVARISGGNWLVDCSCGNCPLTHPDWAVAACFECGAIYRDVAFPPDREQIEELLLKRPMPHRNWLPEEDASDLTAENIAHGVL